MVRVPFFDVVMSIYLYLLTLPSQSKRISLEDFHTRLSNPIRGQIGSRSSMGGNRQVRILLQTSIAFSFRTCRQRNCVDDMKGICMSTFSQEVLLQSLSNLLLQQGWIRTEKSMDIVVKNGHVSPVVFVHHYFTRRTLLCMLIRTLLSILLCTFYFFLDYLFISPIWITH